MTWATTTPSRRSFLWEGALAVTGSVGVSPLTPVSPMNDQWLSALGLAACLVLWSMFSWNLTKSWAMLWMDAERGVWFVVGVVAILVTFFAMDVLIWRVWFQ